MNSVMAWFKTYLLQIVVLLVVVISMYAINPNFHVEASVERLIPLGVISAGLAVTMIAGEFDLSIASMAAFAGALTIVLSPMGLMLATIIAIVVGILLGMLQGLAIARLGINSLVFTVGTLILLRGMTWLITGGVTVSGNDFKEAKVFALKIGFMTTLSLTAIIVIILLGIFLSRSKWGREIYALGGARHEAVAAGVRYTRGMIIAFGISGGAGALGGALVSARGNSAAPNALEAMLVGALAVVLVGGISIAGGKGTMVNVFLGFAIVAILQSGLAAKGAKAFVSELFVGVLLLVVVLLDYLIASIAERGRKKKLRTQALLTA